MNIYARLTLAEQQYLAQDGIGAADINVVDELWTIVDYLTPLYGRLTHEWYEMVRRITKQEIEEVDTEWHMPSFLVNVGHKIKV